MEWQGRGDGINREGKEEGMGLIGKGGKRREKSPFLFKVMMLVL